ncbi:hypothetical protein QR685DRAFT_245221 [Neurospora intermedia]|uniref:Uncharacterized protein n=1 Tax=Neurospora intermedia TaxID=5142 RepID=A0ABR3DBV5_NEUIN
MDNQVWAGSCNAFVAPISAAGLWRHSDNKVKPLHQSSDNGSKQKQDLAAKFLSIEGMITLLIALAWFETR